MVETDTLPGIVEAYTSTQLTSGIEQRHDLTKDYCCRIVHDFKNYFHIIMSNLELARNSISDDTCRDSLSCLINKGIEELRSIDNLFAIFNNPNNNNFSLDILTQGVGLSLSNLSRLNQMVDITLTDMLNIVDNKQHIGLAISVCRKISGLINEFAYGGSADITERLSLKDIVSECLNSTNNPNINYDYETRSEWHIRGNVDQLNSVVTNLLINAHHAMDGGIIKVHLDDIIIEQEHSSLPQGNYVRLRIADQGQGIPKRYLEKIARLEFGFTTKENGTGIGLRAIYELVREHKGVIKVESEEGQGTTFEIYFPAVEDKKIRLNIKNPEIYKGRILVVDDENIVSTVATTGLRLAGYHVDCAASGSETVRFFKESIKSGLPYDLIILDISLPDKDGREVCEELKEINQDVPIIASSGYLTETAIKGYEKDNPSFVGYLPKPYQLDTLKTKVECYIQKNKQ